MWRTHDDIVALMRQADANSVQAKGTVSCQCVVCYRPFIRRKHFRQWKYYLLFCTKQCRREVLKRETSRKFYINHKKDNPGLRQYRYRDGDKIIITTKQKSIQTDELIF